MSKSNICRSSRQFDSIHWHGLWRSPRFSMNGYFVAAHMSWMVIGVTPRLGRPVRLTVRHLVTFIWYWPFTAAVVRWSPATTTSGLLAQRRAGHHFQWPRRTRLWVIYRLLVRSYRRWFFHVVQGVSTQGSGHHLSSGLDVPKDESRFGQYWMNNSVRDRCGLEETAISALGSAGAPPYRTDFSSAFSTMLNIVDWRSLFEFRQLVGNIK